MSFDHFDPMRDVMFRGKSLGTLTPAEAMEALCMTLRRVRYLESIAPDRHRSWGPAAGFTGNQQSGSK